MSRHENHGHSGDLNTIVREASLVDWLLNPSRPRRQPPALPAKLRGDLGLPPQPVDRHWRSYR